MIETSSDVCSVAVAAENNIVAKLENNSRDHSAQLALMIKDVMHQVGIGYKDLSCVGVNGGPGSYTGLRIGLSTAKGLCYAADVPLIMVDSLTAYANALVVQENLTDSVVIISTVENRRDELFYAVFDSKLSRLQDITLTVATNEDLQKRLGDTCIIVGSAVNKLSNTYPATGSLRYVNVAPSAINLLEPVVKMFNEKQFADLAYSEPFYYKEVYIASKQK